MELEGIPSIWDGWEKQCFGMLRNSSGAKCAVEYVLDQEIDHTTIDSTFERVAAYIRAHYPGETRELYPLTIVDANNELKLTPEEFRRIDRLTQYEEGMRQIQEQVEEQIEVPA